VPVDLPASAAQPQPRPDKPVYLMVKADLSLDIADDPITAASLAAALDAASGANKHERILFPRRPSVPYGAVKRAMRDRTISSAGR